MHSSRMCTARSLILSPYLVESHAHPPGATMHAPPRATMHTPRATTHAPQEQPRMPPQSNHARPQSNHACPPRAAMHAPQSTTMHAPPPQSNHACPSQSNHAHPPVDRMTDTCKNITLPQTSFAGGNNRNGRFHSIRNILDSTDYLKNKLLSP